MPCTRLLLRREVYGSVPVIVQMFRTRLRGRTSQSRQAHGMRMYIMSAPVAAVRTFTQYYAGVVGGFMASARVQTAAVADERVRADSGIAGLGGCRCRRRPDPRRDCDARAVARFRVGPGART